MKNQTRMENIKIRFRIAKIENRKCFVTKGRIFQNRKKEQKKSARRLFWSGRNFFSYGYFRFSSQTRSSIL